MFSHPDDSQQHTTGRHLSFFLFFLSSLLTLQELHPVHTVAAAAAVCVSIHSGITVMIRFFGKYEHVKRKSHYKAVNLVLLNK